MSDLTTQVLLEEVIYSFGQIRPQVVENFVLASGGITTVYPALSIMILLVKILHFEKLFEYERC